MSFEDVEKAITAIAGGKIVVVIDDEDRENEGDLIMAASAATPESLKFFLEHTSGYFCVSMKPERLDALEIPLMVQQNTAPMGTAMTVTVDVRDGLTTGISVRERSGTIMALADPQRVATDFVRPGHVQPLRAHPRGVLGRNGHTEAGVDLALLAGLEPAALLCEIVSNDKLDMARGDELKAFAQQYDLPLVSISRLVDYLSEKEGREEREERGREEKRPALQRVASTALPTHHGVFRCDAFRSLHDGTVHLALLVGDLTSNNGRSGSDSAPLVRVHSECSTGDIFGSLRCDCGTQLSMAMREIQESGCGAVIYLRSQDGRGIGTDNKIAAYALQDQGIDTVDANIQLGFPIDARDYSAAAEILTSIGATNIRLMTNNPAKVAALNELGINVMNRVPIETVPSSYNHSYLSTKMKRMNHIMEAL